MKEQIKKLSNQLTISLDYDRRKLSKKPIEDSASFFIEQNLKEVKFYSFYKKYKLLEKTYTASLVLLINLLLVTCVLMILKPSNVIVLNLLVSIGFYIQNFKHLYDILMDTKLRYRFLIFIAALIILFIFNQYIYLAFTNFDPI